MSRLVLASKSAAFEQRVRRAFDGALNGEVSRWGGEIADLCDLRNVVVDLTAGGADVIAVGPDIPVESALALAREFDETRPEISVVVVTEPGGDRWEDALRSGVRDLVSSNASESDLRVALERAIQVTDRRRRNLAGADGGEGGAGRVISVVAPKGGSGKTAVATNLGVALARLAPKKLALVDLDLQFGDVTPTLGLKPESTIADFMRAQGSRDVTTLKVFLTERNDEMYVLCAPDAPEEGEQVTEGVVYRVVDLLAREFPYVVVDTAAGLNEHTLAAIELSTDLVLVCDLSAAGVRGLGKLTTALDRLGMNEARRHIVLNRADSRVGLELADVAMSIGQPIDVRLPSSRMVPTSMNQGVPLAESAPRSAYSQRVTELVGRFAEVPVRAGGWFRNRRRSA